jgi:hypothetical protein
METSSEQTLNTSLMVPVPDSTLDALPPGAVTIPEPPDTKLQWLDTTVPSLKAFLAQEPNAHAGIERILEEYLKVPPTTDTSAKLLSAMQLYLGESADFLLTILVRGAEDRELFEIFVSRLEERDRSWARLLGAVYGDKTRDVWIVGGELPDDWKEVNQEVNLSLYVNKCLIITEIVKYNGEKFRLETRPGSLANLVASLLSPLLQLDPDAARDSLEPAKLHEIAEISKSLLDNVMRWTLRQQLVNAILKVPTAVHLKTRTQWLAGIPSSRLTRHTDDESDDLKRIVDQLDDTGRLESGKHSGDWALLVFVDNVLSSVAEGSESAQELQSIHAEFTRIYDKESEE